MEQLYASLDADLGDLDLGGPRAQPSVGPTPVTADDTHEPVLVLSVEKRVTHEASGTEEDQGEHAGRRLSLSSLADKPAVSTHT